MGVGTDLHGQDAHATSHLAAGVPNINDADAQTRSTGGSPVQNDHYELKIRYGAYLPHLTRRGATYSVTFRLADSLPKYVLEELKEERARLLQRTKLGTLPLTERSKYRLEYLFSDKIENYLSTASGKCWLRNSSIARLITDNLKHFDGKRYHLIAWCIMPNYVHVMLEPLSNYELPIIIHTCKSYTAKAANKILGRKGRFWHAEYYDHLVRDDADYWNNIDYVLRNPVEAKLLNWEWSGICDSLVNYLTV